jgi:hypothetical protein
MSAPRPPRSRVDARQIPEELKELRQWLVWRFEQRDERWTKVPYRTAGRRASTTDPSTWSSFEDAIAAYEDETFDGVGFVFSEDDPFCGIDLDHCLDETNMVQEWADVYVKRLDSYTEFSPSGRGLHIISRAVLPGAGLNRKIDGEHRVEVYDKEKFFTFTGDVFHDSEIRDLQDEVAKLYAELTPDKKEKEKKEEKEEGAAPEPAESTLADEQLLERARTAKNGEKFKRLYDEGDVSGYDSQSEADLALVALLLFWTPDTEQVDQLFRRSRLMRDKWDESSGDEGTYGARTIRKALSSPRESFQGQGPGSTGEKEKKASAAEGLCLLAGKFDLFHTPEREPYATFRVGGPADGAGAPDGSPQAPSGGHRETWPVRSRAVRNCLLRDYYLLHRKPPSAEALNSAVDLAAAMATIDGKERAVHLRVAPREQGGFFLDLADANWRAVEITEDGWHVVSDPPVRFQRRSGLLALPEPERGGSVNKIRSYLNIGGEDAWRLALVWLTHAITTRGPFCVLALHGEQGSAKSTAARVLRCFVDPNKVELRSTPRDERDLAITAEGSWVLAYDNLSSLPKWLSDAFCRLATGSGFSTRELYTDRGEVLFDAMRTILFTGIEELATSGDLLDRSIVLTLPEIGEDDRIEEEDFWQAFNIDKPQLFGALLDVVSSALKAFPSSKPKRLQRMADFHRWGVAVEGALGWPEGSFTTAYIENRAAAVVLALEASLVCRVLLEWTPDLEPGKEWTGTATALLEALERRAGDRARKREWPTHPAHLSGSLRRLAPALRRVGVEVTFSRGKGKAGERFVTVIVNPRNMDKGSSESTDRQTSDASDDPPLTFRGGKPPPEGGREWGRWNQDRTERLRNSEFEARNGEI